MTTLRFLVVLLFAPFAVSAAAPPDAQAPFIYYLIPGSGEVNERLESLGLLPAHGGDAGVKDSMLQPLACVGGQCRRLLEPPATNDPKWYATLLSVEPARAGRFAMLRVGFDGWFLDITSDMYDGKLAETGKFEMTPRHFSIYNGDCSHSLKAENNWAFDSELCFKQELRHAFERIARYWEARLDAEAWEGYAQKLAHRHLLPLARDTTQDPNCKKIYGDYRLLRDLGDHVWFAFPPEVKSAEDSVVISAACGGSATCP